MTATRTPSGVDPRSLDMGGQLDHLAAIEADINGLYALQLDAINALDEAAKRSPFELDKDFVAEDIAARLRISSATAQDRLAFARELKRMPRLFDLLRRGHITVMHARVAARQTVLLRDSEQVEAFLDRVLPRAGEVSVGQFNRACQRAAVAVGVEPEQKRAKAYADRCVRSRLAEDGMAELYAFLPAEQIAAIDATLDRAARTPIPGDQRTIPQRRADHFTDLLLSTPSTTTATASATAPVVAVHVVVAESTLTGHDDEPAELTGLGPLTAEHARELANSPAAIRDNYVVDDTGQLLDIAPTARRGQTPAALPGHLLDYGRTTRTAPAALDRYVRARDVTCRFPGCTAPATTAELDHITARNSGGPTSAANMHALCRRHHHCKHEGRWRVHRHDNGTTEWTSPTGQTYEVPPHRYQPNGPAPPTRPTPPG